MKKLLPALILFVLTTLSFAGDYTINGRVIQAQSGQILSFVNIRIENSTKGTTTNENGQFSIEVDELPVNIIFSHIGYYKKVLEVKTSQQFLYVLLKQDVLSTKAIEVSATRAVEGKTPIAFSTLTINEIETRYSVEDVPMVLSMEPGIYAYSESGNGTGYSYVSIRGFDQSRIAIMLDNVPLNDNESHQVYWVDHGDILSDAKDVQIQRGVGNSLYGASAFGGSINVQTQIAKPEPEHSVTAGYGSYNTQKYNLKYNSGKNFGENLSVFARVSNISSDGYRDHHDSKQNAFSAGIEHRTEKITNQFRTLIGYENTNLAWNGVYKSDIENRSKRKKGSKAYIDDFLQQIYSLNTIYKISDDFSFRNVAYFVKGRGYYEVEKFGENFYEYNLDVKNKFTDQQEYEQKTNLLRRKWLNNQYFGVTPVFTFRKNRYRFDMGTELRFYRGGHYGKVKDFSNDELTFAIGEKWYKYYDYTGEKTSVTSFVHSTFFLTEKFSAMVDLQYQLHKWDLIQDKIGHAKGHKLSADWDFFNPRFGAMYHIIEGLSVFANYGQASKEPADNQIIKPDDVFSEPVMAAAEKVDDYETGFQFFRNHLFFKTNLYKIEFDNEQLKNIDVEQEGEYAYYSAEKTIHQGIELTIKYSINPEIEIHGNASYSQNYFSTGALKDNDLPTTPNILINFGMAYKPIEKINLFANAKYVGEQYLDKENIGKIDAFFLLDLGTKINLGKWTATAKVNNILNKLYSTYGYAYKGDGYHAYYWPGATRNFFVSLSYKI